jgi:CheY-like chemotaxis protein
MADLTGIRVLVVEDHSDSLDLLLQSLPFMGATVAVAGTAREALSMIVNSDVVVTDFQMPGDDGVWLLGLAARAGERRRPPDPRHPFVGLRGERTTGRRRCPLRAEAAETHRPVGLGAGNSGSAWGAMTPLSPEPDGPKSARDMRRALRDKARELVAEARNQRHLSALRRALRNRIKGK